MCRATTLLRRAVGIQDYAPTQPRALVRTSTKQGARGNGYALGGGPDLPARLLIDRLAREQRTIRAMLAEGKR